MKFTKDSLKTFFSSNKQSDDPLEMAMRDISAGGDLDSIRIEEIQRSRREELVNKRAILTSVAIKSVEADLVKTQQEIDKIVTEIDLLELQKNDVVLKMDEEINSIKNKQSAIDTLAASLREDLKEFEAIDVDLLRLNNNNNTN